MDSIYKDDAFAVIQDVNATAIGNFTEAITLFNEVNKTNYDGIVTPTETVVYEPTQIKSATDNIGTFDRTNLDIRFSLRDTVEETDKLYLDAVNRGDMTTAQRMVDEAAKASGYTVRIKNRSFNVSEREADNATGYNKKASTDSIRDTPENVKQKQLETIEKVNPAPNSYLTWIRKVEDIKTPQPLMVGSIIY